MAKAHSEEHANLLAAQSEDNEDETGPLLAPKAKAITAVASSLSQNMC